jgi:uncharacterized membrane protein YdjX (TVP38/TMEM64 family)
VAVAWAIGHRQGFDAPTIEAAIRNMGIWSPLAYMGLYAVATVLFLPGSILGLVGGALFGPFWGVVYTLLGATVGATLAFLAARYVGCSAICGGTSATRRACIGQHGTHARRSRLRAAKSRCSSAAALTNHLHRCFI